MSKAAFDLVIVGVGGQGTLLASKILGAFGPWRKLRREGQRVHGMSQRGGSVITHVRVGDSVHSPMVALGGADYLISFEALEAARAACYLKPGGTAIVNTQHILPMPVITGAAAYPDDPLSALCILPRGKRRRAGHRGGMQAARKRSTWCCWACSAGTCPLRRWPGVTASPPACLKSLWKSTSRPLRAAAP